MCKSENDSKLEFKQQTTFLDFVYIVHHRTCRQRKQNTIDSSMIDVLRAVRIQLLRLEYSVEILNFLSSTRVLD